MFDKVKAKLAQVVLTYCTSWKAVMNLVPKEEFGPWKITLWELKDSDICGPRQEESKPSMSHFVQSWIWTIALTTSTSTEDSDLDSVLWIEWCKAQEQAKHYEEDVELVVKEMYQTLVTFELNAEEWDSQATSPALVV